MKMFLSGRQECLCKMIRQLVNGSMTYLKADASAGE